MSTIADEHQVILLEIGKSREKQRRPESKRRKMTKGPKPGFLQIPFFSESEGPR